MVMKAHGTRQVNWSTGLGRPLHRRLWKVWSVTTGR